MSIPIFPTTYDPIINNAFFLYAYGMNITPVISTLTASISDGLMRDSTNTDDIAVNTNGAGTILNLGINGLNGLDTGTATANTFYQVFAIADPTGYQPSGFIASVNAAPLLPFQYGLYRRIGWLLLNATPTIEYFYQVGLDNTRFYQYTPVATSSGITPADTAFHVVDINYFCPPQVCKTFINVSCTSTVASDVALSLQSGNSTNTNGSLAPVIMNINNISGSTDFYFPPAVLICGVVSSNAAIQYAVNAFSGLTLHFQGSAFEDYI
jgi:hypothetical protein